MRSMTKAIAEFEALAKDKNKDIGTSDIMQIFEMSNDPWDYITNAMMAGYAMGYRQCKRDMKKRPQRAASLPRA